MTRHLRTLGAIAAGLAAVLLIGTPANAAPVTVRAGDTYSGLVQRHCAPGTSWQSLDFGGRDKDLIYAGETIDVRCTPTAAPAAPQVQSTGWVNPVCATHIGDSIGAGRNHKGVDLSAPWGRAIRAAAAGTATRGWQSGGAGNYITIAHGGAWTHYMHMSSFAVGHGQWVAAGQVIGYVGSTGNSSGPHLHYEVRTGNAWGTVNDPIRWMNARGVRLGC